MSFETFHLLWTDYENGKTIRPLKEGVTFSFPFTIKKNKRYRLFTVGQTAQFYQWKNEPDGPQQYHMIDDALDTEHAVNSHYCLNFSSDEPEEYIRRIHKKLLWPPRLSYLPFYDLPTQWEMGFSAAAEDLRIETGGFLQMVIDIRLKKEGVSPASNNYPADETYYLPISQGSYEMRPFAKKIAIPEDAASVSVWIEGKGYSGTVYIEAPFLTGNGRNVLPDFSLSVPEREYFHWSAQYLSRKEWPIFRVMLNGQTVHEGEVFERSHTADDWSVDLDPALLQEHNTLTYELLSDYHDAVPYTFFEIGIAEQAGGEAALIAHTEYAKTGGNAYILIRTEKANTTLELEISKEHFEFQDSYTFAEAGLHGIPLTCLKAGLDLPFILRYEGGEVGGTIPRIAEGEEDGIITGTGDLIYVSQNLSDTEEYLCWYFSRQVGNLVTIRPAYRWSGTRTLQPETWKVFVRLMEETHTDYVLMTDGREAPGLNTNPDEQMMAGSRYRGAQTHENDGGVAYWRASPLDHNMASIQEYDIFTRICREDPDHTFCRWKPHNYAYDDGKNLFKYRNPNVPRDMREGHRHLIERIQAIRSPETRHTGPSALFKYFLEAGYDWVGAETMYSSTEPLLSFLRGAKKAYGIPAVGVHHALQWCSYPHDRDAHVRRYRIALYVSYLLGIDEINTEEGLWRMEEYYSHFHRFTDCCEKHLKQQQDFYRYIATHTRKGTLHAPIALLHGRCDGWLGTGKNRTWGWRAENGMQAGLDTDAERSWELLKLFYPQSRPATFIERNLNESGKAIGCYSSAPLGQVDAIPVEKDAFEQYKVLAFLGYNCAEPEDFERLARYVRGGGTLILTRAHMTNTTALADLKESRFTFEENALSFTNGAPQFTESTYKGIPLSVCTNTAGEDLQSVINTDNGLPLVCRYRYGEGEVLLFNAAAYPAHPAIRELYEQALQETAKVLIAEEPLWAETDDQVEFAVYTQEDGTRSIYLLAIDWYRDPASLRSATLIADGHRYPIELPFGTMIKGIYKDGTLLYPHEESAEVLEINGATARVQGTGTALFTVCRDGKTKDIFVDFTDPVLEISLI
ncbi:MAG: hypothetical protein IJ407_01480 [Clostridia bacterium]|nr:hypothetical protein [Clostridia bacterium]